MQAHCEEIGEKIGAKHIVGLAGMLHDFGKYSPQFQAYIRAAIDHPEEPPKRGSVNHSTAGGQLLLQLTKKNASLQQLMMLIANAIYGHHGTLLDFINIDGQSPFLHREEGHLQNEVLLSMLKHFFHEVMSQQEFNAYINEAYREYSVLLTRTQKKSVLHFFLTKYIFSALIDADRTNARLFDDNEPYEEAKTADFALYENRLTKALVQKQKDAPPNDITRARQYLSDQCYEKRALPTGIYTLSIPTGGGKTLASLRFALRHAQLHNKKRIINIIPFTTIIEQNVKEVRDILQADDLLEHHSNIIEEREQLHEAPSYAQLKQLRAMQHAKDNWDATLIFSTMVQFLHIAYSDKARYMRRFHQLANSIIIFDEIQSLPIQTISLFNELLMFLKDVCNTTVILCTATQPALQEVKHHVTIDGELIDDLETILPQFTRTNIVPLMRSEGWAVDDVATFVSEQLQHVDNCLIIMNTKRHARELYEQLKKEDVLVYHLSTSMCPKHRQDVLKKIREELKTEQKLICISTQLIEAGVDVSFQCVVRALAGLDSIAQAAGRCNRHGEVATRDVFVVNMEMPSARYLPTIVEGAKQTNIVLRDMERQGDLYDGNVLAKQAMQHYFSRYYEAFKHEQHFPVRGTTFHLYSLAFSRNEELVNNVLRQQLPHRHAFKTVGQHFHVIDSNTTAILVPYATEEEKTGEMDGKALISMLEAQEIDDFSLFLKRAQHYSVNVFSYERQLLEQAQMLAVYETPFAHIYYVREHAYSKEHGLSIEGDATLDTLLF